MRTSWIFDTLFVVIMIAIFVFLAYGLLLVLTISTPLLHQFSTQ